MEALKSQMFKLTQWKQLCTELIGMQVDEHLHDQTEGPLSEKKQRLLCVKNVYAC